MSNSSSQTSIASSNTSPSGRRMIGVHFHETITIYARTTVKAHSGCVRINGLVFEKRKSLQMSELCSFLSSVSTSERFSFSLLQVAKSGSSIALNGADYSGNTLNLKINDQRQELVPPNQLILVILLWICFFYRRNRQESSSQLTRLRSSCSMTFALLHY